MDRFISFVTANGVLWFLLSVFSSIFSMIFPFLYFFKKLLNDDINWNLKFVPLFQMFLTFFYGILFLFVVFLSLRMVRYHFIMFFMEGKLRHGVNSYQSGTVSN